MAFYYRREYLPQYAIHKYVVFSCVRKTEDVCCYLLLDPLIVINSGCSVYFVSMEVLVFFCHHPTVIWWWAFCFQSKRIYTHNIMYIICNSDFAPNRWSVTKWYSYDRINGSVIDLYIFFWLWIRWYYYIIFIYFPKIDCQLI